MSQEVSMQVFSPVNVNVAVNVNEKEWTVDGAQ
jgi:hypothetical protein